MINILNDINKFCKYISYKKIVVLIVLIVLICSYTAVAKLPDPEGYTISNNPGWTNGQISGYDNGDCIPFRIELMPATFARDAIVHERILFDQSKDILKLSGVKGIIELKNFILADESDDTDIPKATQYTLNEDYKIEIAQGEHPPAGGNNLVEGYYDIDITFLKDVPYGSHSSPIYLYFCAKLSDNANLWQGCSLHVRRDGANADSQICDIGPQTPGITIIKETNGFDANAPPGPNIPVGDLVTWTYEITNSGNVELKNIRVTDNRLGDIETISKLAAGQSVTITREGTASSGQYSNLGTATVKVSGKDISDTDLSHYFGYVPAADLKVEKTAEAIIKTGEVLTYTITVTNDGPNTAKAVQISDELPVSLANSQYSKDSGINWIDYVSKDMIPLGDINSQSSVTVLIRGTVTAADGTVLNNKATVSAKTADPDTSTAGLR